VPDSSHVGRRYEAPGQVIDRERVRAFAQAIAGEDSVAEPDAVNPTYAAVYCLFPTLGQVMGDPEVGINLAGLIHGEQSFEFHSPVRPGDTIDSTAEITSVEEKRGMTFIGVALAGSRAGQPVCSGRALLIVRGGAS
jgi:hypothetical protein